MNNRVVRVSMFVTPTNPRFIDRAWTRGADAYTLDIEDSIPRQKRRGAGHLSVNPSIRQAKAGHLSM